jgi:L-iditol 2-dehydrogenase
VKAALLRSLDDVAIVEMPAPEIGPGEILVEMKAVGICGSDVTPWYVNAKAPAVLGHEPAGVVAKVAPGVTAFRPGDRVFVHHHAACGTCRLCLAGEPVMCSEWKKTRLHPGGLAEFVRVEAATVRTDTLKLPEGVSFEDGTLIEPVACAVKAVKRGDVKEGDTVAVIGLGSNGILLGIVAKNAGAATLVGSDPDTARRAHAMRLGFDVVLDPKENLSERVRKQNGAGAGAMGRHPAGGADVVFVLPSLEEAVLAALSAAGPAGRVVFYSPVEPGKVWRLSPHTAYLRDLTLRFSYSCGPAEIREALRLIEKGVVRADRIVTHRVPLSRAAEAFRLGVSRGDVLKVLVTF